MDRLWTRLRFRRKDKYSETKSLPKNLSRENTDCDTDYVLNTTDRSLSYDCKRLSHSYTLLSDTPKPTKRGLFGSLSLGDLHSITGDKNTKNYHKKRYFWTSKPKPIAPNGERKGLFSRLRFRSNRNEEKKVENVTEHKLHVLWYASGEAEDTTESRVQFRHSWIENKKEIATSIAAEFDSKNKTKSLSLRNTDRLSTLLDNEYKQKF